MQLERCENSNCSRSKIASSEQTDAKINVSDNRRKLYRSVTQCTITLHMNPLSLEIYSSNSAVTASPRLFTTSLQLSTEAV